MRCVLQRVNRASVSVEGKKISDIKKGLLVFVGIHENCLEKDVQYCLNKILKLKLWDNDETKKSWSHSVTDLKYEVLLVSQFTLYADIKKKNKPDHRKAMKPADAKTLYENFVERMQGIHQTEEKISLVKNGVFGAMMDVELVNDGPVTFIIESSIHADNQETDKL